MKLQDTGLTFEDIKGKVNKYMIETYERFDFLADHAKGVYMYDENDTPYLDFYAGIAVNSVGNCNEKVVKAIINKEIHANVSNAFFILMDNKIYPRTKQTEDQNCGMDTAGFLVMSGDKKMTKSLLKDKIDRGHDLSLTEKTVIVFMAMESIGGKKVPDVPTIARVISSEFKLDIPFDFIEQIRNDYSSEIAKVFGR